MYMQMAIGQVFSKQRVYPDEPLPMDEQAKEKHEVLKNAESIATVMNDMLRGAIHGTTTEDSDNS